MGYLALYGPLIDHRKSSGVLFTRPIVRLEQGTFFNVKSVGEGVFEYRIDFGPGYRVYFGQDGLTLVTLLTGGTRRRIMERVGARDTMSRVRTRT